MPKGTKTKAIKSHTEPKEAHVIENFYEWINERHSIYQKRIRGDSPPWTEDPILREYKFTNPFRENRVFSPWWTVTPNSFLINRMSFVYPLVKVFYHDFLL